MQRYSLKYYKWKRRLETVLSNSARNVIPLGLNSFVSLLVIKFSSFTLWGELVSYLIVINLAAQLFGWGSKQYLLREFAANPANAGNDWYENMKARLPLLLFTLIITVLINIPDRIKIILMVWQSIMFFSRSYEVLILYFRRMKFFLVLEIILSVMLLSILFFFRNSISVQFVLTLYAINELIRLIVSAVYFWNKLKTKFTISINFKILSVGFAFFALGTLGMLQSRLDLYFVALLLPKHKLAVYQVLINYILLIQAATGFVIQPYLKEIYRMNRQTLAKFSFKFTTAGIVASVPITIILVEVLKYVYGISLDWQAGLLTFVYIIPIFYYTIRINLLLKIRKESLILLSGIIVLLLSLPLEYYFISLLGLTGALIAGVSGELLSLFAYFYFEKRVGLVGNSKIIFSDVKLIQQ